MSEAKAKNYAADAKTAKHCQLQEQSFKADLMDDNNPFSPTQTVADPANVTVQETSWSAFDFVHSLSRGLLAFFFFGVAPVFIVPALTDMFEEFGIELPLMTQLVIQYSNRVGIFALLFLPFALGIFAGIELVISFIPAGTSKKLINIVYWLALILAIGFAVLSMAIPLFSIATGL